MATPSVPRLKDVAQAANVSLAAASRILHGDRERFGAETCERVLEASRQLGWRRNLLVNGMQTGRSQTIGVMMPPCDSFWVRVLSGIHDTLAAADYLPITVWTGNIDQVPSFQQDESEGKKQINRLLDRRVDGLIMWPKFGLAYYDYFPEFVERRVPVTVIDHYSAVSDSVETDEEQATAAVADHLLKLGHRRIACISRSEGPTQTWALHRRTSFEAAVAVCPEAQVKTWRLNADESDGVEVARAVLQDEFRPTAVFAVTDYEAAFVHRAAQELGRKVPEELSLVGFADMDFAPTMTPPLTTVRQMPYELGRAAARLLLDRIEGALESDESATVRVGAELIVRGSTGPAKDA